ncbi:MAG: NUDIX hydrolase [Oscillibacter sp.]|nr:NUDIX hydrolase [Oscillibacter sp.]
MKNRDRWLAWAEELQSLAQAGLYYGTDRFDLERYQRIREISAEMLSDRTDLPIEKVRDLFCGDVGYQTPKLDTRAAIIRDGKILLVREADGRWSMPGGWCDYDRTPWENTIKEAKEEAGADITVDTLAAVQDRERHNAPPHFPFGVVKLFFLCTYLGGEFTPNIETTERAWFSEDALPPLSEGKCTAEQVRLCFAASRDPHWKTVFD